MRRRSMAGVTLAVVMLMLVGASGARAQLSDTRSFLVTLDSHYRMVPNVTYHEASGQENKLDLYLPRNASGATPVLLVIHGGGWVIGEKETYVMRFLPYLEMGWAVVNVEYRLAKVALAPAAVEDCLCALRWIGRHAEEHNLDTSRIVVTGNSAGGHLSLTTGMIPSSAGLDRQCEEGNYAGPRAPDPVKVAAIINWYGITDVADLLEGPNTKGYTVEWLGSLPNRGEVANRVSPLTYVRPGLPPVLTIHGDADPIVPYQHAVQLRDKLEAAGVPNQLHTVRGGSHGGFSPAEMLEIYETIYSFLDRHGLGGGKSTSQQD